MEVTCAPPATEVACLYGRDQERHQLDQLIGAAGLGRSGALLLQGDVGTGKTALLEYALARAGGMAVLRCQAERAESELRFAALHQLLQPVLGLVDELPGRLAEPLAAALGGSAGGGIPDGFVVGAALLALLTRAARERPLLCVVDDGQWLDRASADAISFAARRVHDEGVVLLVAVRDGEGRTFEPAGVPVLRLAGLDPRAAARLLAERAGGDLAPEVTRRLVEHTGGLPLALADAAVSLTPAQLAGRAPLSLPLPLSPRLRDAFLRRVRRLPGPTQRLLLLVAAAQPARVDVVAEACAELGIGLAALANAEAAGMVHIDETVVRLRSQLVHAAVYAEAPFFERRAAHLALARSLGEDDEDRRAWHEAAAALVRDGRVAADLERAAMRAGVHGDPAASADALQRAAQLTPHGPERARRLTAAASACWFAGRSVQALELLDRAERLRPAPLLGADVAELRGVIALRRHDQEGARDALMAGVDLVAAEHPDRALKLLIRASRVAVAGFDAAGAHLAACRAAALNGGHGDGVALLKGVARVMAGRIDETSRVAERAISMALSPAWGSGDPEGASTWLLGLATWLSAGGDLGPELLASALDLLGGEVGRLRAQANAGALPAVLANLAWLEVWADRFQAAHANASEGLALARSLGQPWVEAGCARTLAMLAAIRGDEEARAALCDVLHHPPGVQCAPMNAGAATWAAALADLGACRFAEAQTRLEDLTPGRRLGHPWLALWSRPDAVEAGVRTGRLGPARAALQVLERAARPDWPAPASALLARSRALLATGREADHHYGAALAMHAEAERPFQQARTRLLWAEHLRRNRRRLDAREQLRAAVETFERLEARPWADRARAELRATGETVRRRDGCQERLTPQERRIAELVADGGSNREVAEQLFLSPRTVGYHLARVYQKLGVSSRTRLAAFLREDELAEATEVGQRQKGLSGRAKTEFRSRSQAAAAAPEREVGDVVPLPVGHAEPGVLPSAGPRAS
ncbi:MAG TPA: AAA family ATPase [Terriglobales bacterium]|nr:AAA family ATPase [Terriglobales bacterium]